MEGHALVRLDTVRLRACRFNAGYYPKSSAMKSTQRSAISYQRSTARAVFFSLLVAHCSLLLFGCVPAAPPIQLQATPGAFVRVDEHIYDAGAFRVANPPGWRIVKSSIAAAPMQVVFVSPDETMTITVSEIPIADP